MCQGKRKTQQVRDKTDLMEDMVLNWGLDEKGGTTTV